MTEEINSVGQNMWILTDKHNSILQHNQGKYIQECLERKHA